MLHYLLMTGSIVFILIIEYYLVKRLVYGFRIKSKVKNWKQANGVVVEIEPKHSMFSDTDKNAYIHYEYDVGEEKLYNNEYSPFSVLYDYEVYRNVPVQGVVNHVCKYNVGDEVVVNYDEADPLVSFINIEISTKKILGLVALAVFLLLMAVLASFILIYG